jgi:hypothetical protein
MKKAQLQEVAKFAAGLVVGDLLALLWFNANNLFPVSFFGMTFSSDVFVPAVVFDLAIIIMLVHYAWHVGKIPAVREHTYLLVAGCVFGFVAIAHLSRIFVGGDFILFGWDLPLWLSGIGTFAAAYLSYMSFHLAVMPNRRR